MGQPRHFRISRRRSALAPIADIPLPFRNRRVVPQGDICSAANCILFDHLVGAAEQRDREGEAECLGGLKVDDKLHSCHLLDR
jgi:hypothetical protein